MGGVSLVNECGSERGVDATGSPWGDRPKDKLFVGKVETGVVTSIGTGDCGIQLAVLTERACGDCMKDEQSVGVTVEGVANPAT